LSRLTN